ncbi:MAG TPA: beta-galactosidase [Candidatus Limnocylindrales bacterium]|nr:beta-galactosidase [Candidatus Limnocylindrales bacterium]
MRLGTSYYPEHWPETRWAVDARGMADLGLRVVRMAEFSWARLEPAPGELDLAWLDRAIDVMAAAGLEVMLGTPSATPPAWLTRAEPEILLVDAEGRRRNHGGRRHACPSNESFRDHVRRIVTVLGERYGRDERVTAWQIDNELGGSGSARCHCDASAAAFREWLRARYGSLDALNHAWGTMVWSQRYTAWEQITPPILQLNEPNPSHALDFRRFSTDAHAGLAALQVAMLRDLAPGRPTFTNFMGPFTGLDPFTIAATLDVAGWDSYPTGNVERWAGPCYGDEPVPARGRPYAYDVGDPYLTGFAHDLTRGLLDRPFWVTEQQAGHINWARQNPEPRPGTARLWTWHAAFAGADTCLYYHWQAAVMGQEQYHSGLLRHDGSPDEGHREVARVVAELDGPSGLAAVTAAPPRPAVALLVSWDDLWALELQPHRAGFTALRLAFAWYRALARLGVDVDLVPSDPDHRRAVERRQLTGYRVVVAPTVHLVGDRLAGDLAGAVDAGAHVFLGVRSGFKEPSSLVTTLPLPGRLRALAGTAVRGWEGMPPGLEYPLRRVAAGGAGGADAHAATAWAEALEPDPGTEVLLDYAEGRLEGRAAVTTRAHGNGRVTYVGVHPTVPLALALLEPALDAAGVRRLASAARPLPDGILAGRRGDLLVALSFRDEETVVEIDGEAFAVPARGVVVRPVPATG